MRIFKFLVAAVGMATAFGAAAGSDEAAFKERLTQTLSAAGVKVDDVRTTPITGVAEVVSGMEVMYVSADGRYMIMGEMIDLQNKSNLSRDRRRGLVKGLINGIDDDQTIIFQPAGEVKRSMTVFTDVDCPYCVKFHRQVPALMEAGVQVRYLMWPRAGMGSNSHKRAVAVWCAEDRQKAMGLAKFGGDLELKECPNPIADHYRYGRDIGLRGTPTLVFDDGRVFGGYLPAKELLVSLGLSPKPADAIASSPAP